MRNRFARLIVLLMCGCPLNARGDTTPVVEPQPAVANLSVYKVNYAIDGPIIGVAALGAALPLIFEAQIITKNCPCDSNEVNKLDRPVIQYDSKVARTTGDVLVAVTLAAPPVLDMIDLGFSNPAFREDFVVYAEVLAVNSAISNAFRYTTQRPRPDAYKRSPEPSQPGAFASFYSGHAASAFAALSAASMTYNYRYGPHVWPWVVTAGLGTAEAATRVLAGRHFYTDTAVGVAAGLAIGISIPYLHHRNKNSTVRITPEVTPESVKLVFRRDF